MAKTPVKKVLTRKEKTRLEREQTQRRFILWGSIVVLTLVFGIVGYGILDQYVIKGLRTVASVEGEKFTVNDFQDRVRYSRFQLVQRYLNTYQVYQMFSSDTTFASSFASNLQQYDYQLKEENKTVLGQAVIDQIIEDAIIAHEAERVGISVSEEEIDAEMQASFSFFPNGTSTPTITPTNIIYPPMSLTQESLITPTPTATVTLEPTATATQGITPTATTNPEWTPTPTFEPTFTSTPYTLEGYQANLDEFIKSLETDQLNESILRLAVRSSLLRQKLLEYITSDMQPESEQVWVRHVLVADEATANVAYDRLVAGEDWNTVAAEMSTDPGSQNIGGNLGWVSKGQMVAEFENPAFSLDIGQISEPVQSEYGWHVIQVIGHEMRPLTATEFADAKQTKFDEWLSSKVSSDEVIRYDTWQSMIPMEPSIPLEYQMSFD